MFWIREIRNECKNLVEKLEEKCTFGTARRIQNNNIKMYLKETDEKVWTTTFLTFQKATKSQMF